MKTETRISVIKLRTNTQWFSRTTQTKVDEVPCHVALVSVKWTVCSSAH